MAKTANLDDLKAIKSPTITAEVASRYLGCSPHRVRLMARKNPERLGFPVCCPTETRVLIPTIPFMRFLGIDVEDEA